MGSRGSVEVEGVAAEWVPGADEVLTPLALGFVRDLCRTFAGRRDSLLGDRRERLAARDRGAPLDFLHETAHIRAADWRVADPPVCLRDRRVEITGPVDRKMIIHALNSGARVYMADFEDATSPVWRALVEGQKNLRDAVRRTISVELPAEGGAVRRLALHEETAVLFVRPRGLHLPERHVRVDGHPAPGALVDFGLFFFHNAQEQLARGAGPFFYLPKLEHHLEARWWNDVFAWAEAALGVPRACTRATVLIETLPAALQMDEILYELRERSAGLNCGRWDYIFSFVKQHRRDPGALLPDRGQVTMEKGFLRAYSERLIATCHRRGAHAIGGMSALIPRKDDPVAHEAALAQVRADKLREVTAGHDGTWVAHPGLVPVAQAVFDAHMPGQNQLERVPDRIPDRDALLALPEGTRTEAGLRQNVRVGLRYLAAWLAGLGCVPIDHLMEDAATAEICRTQLWQWLHLGASVGGAPLTVARFREVLEEERRAGAALLGPRGDDAVRLFQDLIEAEELAEFLTLPAYDLLDRRAGPRPGAPEDPARV